MDRVVMFLHGQGVATAEKAQGYLRLVEPISDCDLLPLVYGPVVEELGLGVLDRSTVSRDDSLTDSEEELAQRAEDQIIGLLQIEEPPLALAPAGRTMGSARHNALATYTYSSRYLARHTVHQAVLATIQRQALQYIQEHGLQSGAITLLAHSLGTVVSLDLLNGDLGHYFGRYISLGSPLGGIARLYGIGNQLLPPRVRKVACEWIDVAAPDDFVAFKRISPDYGFEGKSLRIIEIARGYDDPHGAYLSDRNAFSEWAKYLTQP